MGTINRFKCPACGGEQYTSLDEVSGCIHCDYTGPLEKKDHLEPDNESEVEQDG